MPARWQYLAGLGKVLQKTARSKLASNIWYSPSYNQDSWGCESRSGNGSDTTYYDSLEVIVPTRGMGSPGKRQRIYRWMVAAVLAREGGNMFVLLILEIQRLFS